MSTPLELVGAMSPVLPPDSRRIPGIGNISGIESGEPSTDGLAKRLNFKTSMNVRETIEFQEPRSKQVPRPQ